LGPHLDYLFQVRVDIWCNWSKIYKKLNEAVIKDLPNSKERQ